MATKVTARIDYVVQATNGNGMAFEPFEETLDIPIEDFTVESKEQIIADGRKVVLALRPVADGRYQMMRRKADIELSNDIAANALRLRQIALKVQFEKSNQPAAVAAYPITKDIEFTQSQLEDGHGWTLILTEEPGAGGKSLFRLFNVVVPGGGVVPPCQNPAIDCNNPRNRSELLYCEMNKCV
jgi:hypothetical protein